MTGTRPFWTVTPRGTFTSAGQADGRLALLPASTDEVTPAHRRLTLLDVAERTRRP
ncbi:hypothetical protein ABZV31_30990 [Streptomyces sp. NPDC005202]|uniref:hypothetical protein n=1 Tax=Streptomyces sp. NPDC005202 TaxID=3157021 RepID=UPI0033B51F10